MDILEVLNEARRSAHLATSILVKDEITLAALRWELYSSLQSTLDAISMVIADLGLRKPSTYAGFAEVLVGAKVLNEEDGRVLKEVTIARNALAHTYRRLSPDDLQGIVHKVLPQLDVLWRRLSYVIKERQLDPLLESKLSEVFLKHGVKLAYLFGSRARKECGKESDYDIAVVFGREADLIDEVKIALDVAEALDVPLDNVDIVLLDSADVRLLYRVMKEGKLIFSTDEKFRKCWERSVTFRILEAGEISKLIEIRRKATSEQSRL